MLEADETVDQVYDFECCFSLPKHPSAYWVQGTADDVGYQACADNLADVIDWRVSQGASTNTLVSVRRREG